MHQTNGTLSLCRMLVPAQPTLLAQLAGLQQQPGVPPPPCLATPAKSPPDPQDTPAKGPPSFCATDSELLHCRRTAQAARAERSADLPSRACTRYPCFLLNELCKFLNSMKMLKGFPAFIGQTALVVTNEKSEKAAVPGRVPPGALGRRWICITHLPEGMHHHTDTHQMLQAATLYLSRKPTAQQRPLTA